MAVTVCFQPGKEDLRRMGFIGIRARPLIFWLSVTVFIFIPVIVAIFAFVTLYGTPRFKWAPVVILLLVPVISAVGFYNIPAIIFGKSPAFGVDHTYTFDDKEIFAKSSAFESRITWDIITSCFVHPFGVLLYSGKAPVISVPRRALIGSCEADLVRMVREKGIKIEGNA